MPDQPKTPQRTIRIDDELWAAARAKAVMEGTNVSAIVRAAVIEYLKVSRHPAD
jgi:hypothetical protein